MTPSNVRIIIWALSTLIATVAVFVPEYRTELLSFATAASFGFGLKGYGYLSPEEVAKLVEQARADAARGAKL